MFDNFLHSLWLSSAPLTENVPLANKNHYSNCKNYVKII